MGFPFDEANWALVEEAMYIGAGGSAPGWYTLISAVLCVAALWIGNRNEQQQYEKN